MKRVLVTGSSGFIGRNAVPIFVARGYEVHAADLRSVPGGMGVIPHQVDLLDDAQVSALMAKIEATHLVHFAWYAEHGKFWNSPLNLDWVAASVRLLKAFSENGGQRAVCAGTCAEYDWSQEHLSEDQTPSRPATLYGVCKNSLRMIAESFARNSRMSLAWGRIFFLYGPGEHPKRFIPAVLNPLLQKESSIVKSGGHVRDFMHVEDVARAFAAILDSSIEGVVNVASGGPTTLGEVATILGELVGSPELVQIEHAPGTPDNPRVMTAEVRKLQSIGFAPKYSLQQGLGTLIVK